MPHKLPCDLNVADADDLSSVQALGSTRAQAIVDYREEHGDFENWEQLEEVPGISQPMIEAMQQAGFTLEGEEPEPGEEDVA